MKLYYFNCVLITFLVSLTIGLECFAQGKVIFGKVTDADGVSIPGVNVVIKGTTTGTVTDLDGQYSISANETDVLVFSYLGYLKEEISVGSQTEISVTLVEDLIGLSEVVVIGYGTVKRSDVTGSLVSVTEETIQERPVQNVLQAMQGKAAGVDVFSNHRPGEVANVQIRGNKSLTATTAQKQPLYVVDGIVLMGNLNDINPNDIASMEILKDASATAIYGSRGANGVILITTKKGSKGKISVNYNGTVALDNIRSVTDWADAGHILDRKRLAYINGGIYTLPYPDPAVDIILYGNNDYWTINAIRQGYEWEDPGTYENVKMRPATAEEQEKGWPEEVPVYNSDNIPSYDWIDLLTQTGVTNDHNLSISTGTENSALYFSFGYLNNTGTQLNQSYKRYTSKLNGDVNLANWLRLGTAISISKSDQQYGTINRSGSATGAKDLYGLALGMYPLGQPYDTLGELINYPGNNAGAPVWNPLIDIDNSEDKRMASYFQGNLYGEVKFTPWLRYKINFGAGMRYYKKGTWQGKQSTLRRGASAPTATAGIEIDETFQWMVENLLYLDKTFGLHTISATFLQSAQVWQKEEADMSADQIINDSPKWYDLGANRIGTISDYKTSFQEKQFASYMGRINYSLMDRYLVTASIRYDGSSVLAPDNKWDLFPSFALAWKMEEENFMNPVLWLTQMKIRLGYGVTGNASVDPYVTSGPLTQYDYIFGTNVATGYIPGTMPNPNLGWEKTAQTNIGLDFGLYNDRIYGTIDFYKSNIYDLLMERNVPPITGFTEIVDNIGKMKNRGIEISLNTINISTPVFSWKTDLNFAANREEIVELVNGKEDMYSQGLQGNGWLIGQPAEIFRNYKTDGLWQDTPEDSVEMVKWREQGGISFSSGQYKPDDLNNNYMLEDSDKVVVGTPNPKWIGGITNTFTYKNIKLSFFIYARVGQSYFASLQPGGTNIGSFISYARYEDPDNLWSPEHPDAKYPQPTIIPFNRDVLRSTYVNDGSFFIMRNISISYDFPKPLLNRIKVSNLQVYGQVLNPFIFGGDVVKAGYNPDDTNRWHDINSVGDPVGGTNNNTIITKSWVFGIRIGL